MQSAAIAGSGIQHALPEWQRFVAAAGPKDQFNWRPNGPAALGVAVNIKATREARCACDAVTDALANCAGDLDRLVPRERGTALSVELGERARTLHRAFTKVLDWLEADAPYPVDAARDMDAGDSLWRASDLIARAMRTTPQPSASDQAFGAALEFVSYLDLLAHQARAYRPEGNKPDAWQDAAMAYAMAFVAWFDLTHLLTPAVRTQARQVYPPGAPAIKLGKAKPLPTVIEAVANELGIEVRNAVYIARFHPLEPDLNRLIAEANAIATARQVAQGKPAEPRGAKVDLDELIAKETRAAIRERLGIKTLGDARTVLVDEWNKLGRERGEVALDLLRFEPIDFADLRVQLTREAEAVIAAASKPSGTPIETARFERRELAAAVDAGDLERVAERAAAKAVEAAQTREPVPVLKLPNLGPHDRQAWQLATLHGMTQDKVALALNVEHGMTYSQGQVSRMIARAKAHAEANGLAEKVAGPIDRPRTIDPARLELGARVDKRKPRPSDMARLDDDDE